MQPDAENIKKLSLKGGYFDDVYIISRFRTFPEARTSQVRRRSLTRIWTPSLSSRSRRSLMYTSGAGVECEGSGAPVYDS